MHVICHLSKLHTWNMTFSLTVCYILHLTLDAVVGCNIDYKVTKLHHV